MTSGILRSNALNPDIIIAMLNNKGIGYWNNFYEHKYDTSGFVFMERELRNFVNMHKLDPAGMAGTGLKNYSDEMAAGISINRFFVIKNDHKLFERRIITSNYDRFEIWVRK